MAGKRYESDLTTKEKCQLEWEKIKSMTWKERIVHIWLYYKVYMVLLIALIFVISVIATSIENSKYETMLNVTLINSGLLESEQLEEDFRAYIGDEEKYHDYVVDANYYLTGNEGNDYNYVIKLTTMVAAEEIDILIATEEQYNQYAEMDGFLPMDEILTEEQKELPGIDVLEYGIHFTESEKLQEYGLLPGNDYYLGIFVYSDNVERAKEFIEYAFGGEE